MDHRNRTALYYGVEPYADDPGTYPKWGPAHQRDLGEGDFGRILAEAKKWLGSPTLVEQASARTRDQLLRHALDLAIQTTKYNRQLHPAVYNMLLARLAGEPEPGPDNTLLTIQGSTCAPSKPTETMMTTKLSAEQSKRASGILGKIDKLAEEIQEHHESWGMSFEDAKHVVNALDRTADHFERRTFGEESFARRQREVLAGGVLQRDSDEPYMDTFEAPMAPIQTDADEPYMSAYADD